MAEIDTSNIPSPVVYGDTSIGVEDDVGIKKATTTIRDTGDVITDTQARSDSSTKPTTDYSSPSDIPTLPKPEASDAKVVNSNNNQEPGIGADKAGAEVAAGSTATTAEADKNKAADGAKDSGETENKEAEGLFVDPKKTDNEQGDGSADGGGAGTGQGGQSGANGAAVPQGVKTGGSEAGVGGAASQTQALGQPAEAAEGAPQGANAGGAPQSTATSGTTTDVDVEGTAGQPAQTQGAGQTSGSASTQGAAATGPTAGTGQTSSTQGTGQTAETQGSGQVPGTGWFGIEGDPQIGALTPEQQVALTAINSGQMNSVDNKTITSLMSSSYTLDSLIGQAESLIAGLPDSPAKASFKDFLQEISKALIEFTTLLYQLQGEDLKQAKKSATVQMEAANDQIETRRKQEHKRIKAEKKKRAKAKLGVFGKILSFIKILFLAIAAAVVQMIPGLGQVAGAFIVAAMVDEFCKTFGIKFSLTQQMMKGVASMVVAIAKAFNKELSEDAIRNIKTGAKAFVAAVNIAAMVLSPVSFALGGGAIIQSTLLDSGIITDPKLKQILGITLMAAQFVATIVMTVVMMMLPGAQGAAVANLSQATLNMMDKAKKIADIVEIVSSVTQAVLTVTTGVNNILLAELRRKLTLALGELEESLSLIQTLIKMMKDLITKLQESIGDYSKQINIMNSVTMPKTTADLGDAMQYPI